MNWSHLCSQSPCSGLPGAQARSADPRSFDLFRGPRAVVEVAGPHGLASGVDDDGARGPVVGEGASSTAVRPVSIALPLLRNTWVAMPCGRLLPVRVYKVHWVPTPASFAPTATEQGIHA
jgi:hypothetical protein